MSKFSLTAQLNLQAPKNTKQVLNKIKGDLKGVSVPIEAKGGAQAVKELNKVAKSTKDVQKQTKLAASQFDRMGKAVGKALTHVARFDVARRIFYGFASAVEQGVTDAIQFEREMLKVAQVAQTSTKNLQGLTKTITSLSTSLGVSAQSLAKTSLILKQTGLSIKDVQVAMAALAKTELAPTFDNIASTAETAVAAMRQFGLQASQLEGLLGKVNAVAGQFAVESRDIGQAIIRTGGAFKAAGGNVEELIALFTSVRATTRETAETIATGFRTIFTRLQRPKTIEFLRQFGIELTDLNGKFVGPYEAVSRLNKALAGLESTDLRFSAIVEQLGGFRQVSKVIPLIQQFGTAQAALAAQQGGANSLTDDATKAQAALAVQLAKVKEEMKALMREVVASEGFQIMVKGAMGLARALVKVGEAITPLLPMLTAMATFKLGSMALGGLGSMMGRKQAGGRISRFSQGGWVPGSGNGDTVPALLEPGEFVLRKSAAQAFGPALNGINKYAGGGSIKGTPKQITKHYEAMGEMSSQVGEKVWSKRKNAAWKPKHQFNYGDTLAVNNEVIGIPKTELSKDKPGVVLAAQEFKKARSKQARGRAWEKVLRVAGVLGNRVGNMDGTYKGGGLADAALSKSSHRDAHMVAKALSTKGPAGLKHLRTSSESEDHDLGINTKELIPAKGVITYLRKIGTIPVQSKPKTSGQGPAFSNTTSVPGGMGAGVKRRATGGGIFGSGLSPVLLTPGEFVVNKSSARSIGYGKLGAMNKYATGGRVGKGGVRRFQGGGMAGAMTGGIDPMALMSFNMMGEAAGNAAKGITSMGSAAIMQIAMFQAAGGAVKHFGESLGLPADGLGLFTDTLANGVGSFMAASKAAEAMPESFGKAVEGWTGGLLMDPKKYAAGGVFGGMKSLSGKEGEDIAGRLDSAAKGQAEAQAHKDAVVADTQAIKEKFKAEDAAATQKMEEIKASKAAIQAKMKEIEASKKAEMIAGGARKNVGKDAVQMALRKDKGGEWMQLAGEEVALETERKKTQGKKQWGRTKVQSDLKVQAQKNQEAKTSLSLAKKENAAAQKRAKALKAFGMGLQLAIAAVGAFGAKMKDDAMKTIAEGDISGGRGEAAVRQAGIGGAMSGAAAGAQAGAVFGPWGMAIGGAIGGIKGFIDATAEAEKALRARRFQDATEAMAESMEKFSEKEIDATEAMGGVLQARRDMVGQYEDPKDAEAADKQTAANTKLLMNEMANSADSVADFDTQIEHLIPSLKEYGYATDESIQKIRDEINARIESQRKMEEAARAREEEIRQLRRLKGAVSAFDEAAYRAKKFGDSLAALATPVGKVNLGGGIAGDMRTGSTDKESIARLESIIDRLGNVAGEQALAGSPGTGMGRFAQEAKGAAFIERNVQSMVLAASQGTNLNEDTFATALKEQLEASLAAEGRTMQDFGPDFERRISNAIVGLGPELVGEVADPSTREGAIKQVEEKLKGSQQEMLDGFKKVASLVDSHVNELGGYYVKRNQLELDYLSKIRSAMQTRFDAEQTYAKNISVSKFGGTTDDQVQRNFKKQQATLLASQGLDTGMSGDVSQLANAFKDVRAKLDKNTKALAEQDPSQAGISGMPLGEGMAKLTDQTYKLQQKYSVLKQALQDNTNATQRLSALQEALKREQERQKTLEQLTFDVAYGTAEEKDTGARLINAMNTAMQAGTVTAVDPKYQRQVARMLMNLGPEGEKIVRKDQNKFLGMSGVAPTAAGGVDYQGITAASDKQIEIAGKILEIQKSSATAQEALAGDVKTSINTMSSAISTANSKFLKELKTLLAESFQRDIAQDEQVTEARKKSLGTSRSDFENLGFSKDQQDEKMMQFLDTVAKNMQEQANQQEFRTHEGKIQGQQYRGKRIMQGFDDFIDEMDNSAIWKHSAPKGGVDQNWMQPALAEEGSDSSRQALMTAKLMADMFASGAMSSPVKKGAGRGLVGRTYTQEDIDTINKAYEGEGDVANQAKQELGARVRERILEPMKSMMGEEQYMEAVQRLKRISGTVDPHIWIDSLENFAQDMFAEQARLEDELGKSKVGFGKGGSGRTQIDQIRIEQTIADEIRSGVVKNVGGKQLKAEDYDTDAKMKRLVAQRIQDLRQAMGDPAEFTKRETEVEEQQKEIQKRKTDLNKELEAQGLPPADGVSGGEVLPPIEQTAASAQQSETYLQGLYDEGVAKKSSIAVHDKHCETILTTIANALTGGEGTAANPTSETGGVAFTQSLDSRGFQDGVDKFSQTVDGLREVMAGALTIEVGGTVTLDINLKEGAGFLQDSQNALGILVSGKINDAINNFIRNGLKDARINTGSWAADDSGTALSSNSNTSGGMGLS
jgi:TP901 family phage tail tape measure protein